jgi:hypothetical protein
MIINQQRKDMYNRQDIFYQLYKSYGDSASFKNIPIVLLEDFKKSFKGEFKYRIRYRGPREAGNRSWANKQSTCLKRYAERFSVYETY